MVRPIPYDSLLALWPLWLLPLAISAAFYFSDSRDQPVRRLVSSLHGLLLSMALVYSVIAAAFTWDPHLPDRTAKGINLPFGLMLLGALVSVAVSFGTFRGPRLLLLLHVATLVLLFFVALVGGTGMSHISL